MSWNYRVMRHTISNGEEWYGIHEVYYEEDGTIKFYSTDSIHPHGETEKELQKDLEMMQESFNKAVLPYNDNIISQKL